jgi:hypothetical protein
MISWRRFKNIPLFWAFIASLIFSGPVKVPPVNPNTPGDLDGWDETTHEESLKLIVQEGRAQLDRQTERLTNVGGRAQVLLGIGLAVLAYGAAVLGDIAGKTAGLGGAAITIIWIGGFLTTLSAVLGAGAIMVVRAEFNDVDTTQISSRQPPLLKSLAIDYAEAVIEGENTVAARVRLLRTTTRVLLVGAGLVAIANAAAQF